MVLLYTVLVGCEKKPEVVVERSEDPVYQKELASAVTERSRAAGAREKIARQMEELVARARAALPQGSTDEQVKAELEGNPEKYPGWKALSEALVKANARLDETAAKARDTVRARILKEAADQKAVAEGRATAKKPVASK